VDTAERSVTADLARPPAADEAPDRPRLQRWHIASGLFGVLVLAVIVASVVRVPYYRIAPGEARPASGLITVDGAESFPPEEGDIRYATVRIGPESAMSALLDWINPAVDVVDERVILGDQTREENREQNLAVMGASIDTATYVALERLGYDVEVSNAGVLVFELTDGAPSADVLQVGDIIDAVDGRSTPLPDDLSDVLADRRPGDEVTLTVRRDGGSQPIELQTRLTEADDGRAIIGVRPAIPADITFEFPVDVSIDSGAIGGPSAGLAFTLALIDQLTPGELTGGVDLAATGTISIGGVVGNVGGVRQKAIAVARAGADVFLVPADEVDEARLGAGDSGMRVEPVETLDDALVILAELGGNGDEVIPARA
jgi:Lon-like protease